MIPEDFLTERRRIHAAAKYMSDGKDWYSARFTIGAGDDPGEPDEIIGDATTLQYATAIVDAHNTQPKLVAALEKVLEVCDRAMSVKVQGSSENDVAMAAAAAVIRREITAALGGGEGE